MDEHVEVGDEVGYIMYDTTGVVYTNQVGGYACRHPEAEGRWVPAPSEAMQRELDEHFYSDNGPYRGHCYEGITEATAGWLDDLMARHGLPLRVNRSMLEHCMEAWIYCVTKDGEGAVLTWLNSD